MDYKAVTDAMVDDLYNTLVDIAETIGNTELATELETKMDELDEQTETEEVKIRSLLALVAEKF